jgi:hypothetical protein
MDAIIEDQLEEVEAGEVYKIEKDILHYERPNTWNVHEEGNMERSLEVDFHKFGVAVTEQTGMDLNKISTFTFYASVEHLKEKNKKRHG